MSAMIADFGKKADGYNEYHIHGTKEGVEKAILQLKEIGLEIREPYKVYRAAPHINSMYSDYMTVLYVWVPEQPARGKQAR